MAEKCHELCDASPKWRRSARPRCTREVTARPLRAALVSVISRRRSTRGLVAGSDSKSDAKDVSSDSYHGTREQGSAAAACTAAVVRWLWHLEKREFPSPHLGVHCVLLCVRRHLRVHELQHARPLLHAAKRVGVRSGTAATATAVGAAAAVAHRMHDELGDVPFELGNDLRLVSRAAVAHDGEHQEVAVVAARHVDDVALELGKQLVALRGVSVLEARLNNARGIVLLENASRVAGEERQNLIH